MFYDIHAVNSLAMAEILFAEHLFAHVLPKRGKYPLRLILSSAACLLFASWFPVPSDDIATIVPYPRCAALFVLPQKVINPELPKIS